MKKKYGYNVFEQYTRVTEIPFDSERKLMTTVHPFGDKYIVYTKGGVDELLKCCNSYQINSVVKTNLNEYINTIQSCNKELAESALRVLATGYKIIDRLDEFEINNLESNLTFVGLV